MKFSLAALRLGLLAAVAPKFVTASCVPITKVTDFLDPNLQGKTVTFCSFDVTSWEGQYLTTTGGCDLPYGKTVDISSTTRTTWICEQGGTCRFNCAGNVIRVMGDYDDNPITKKVVFDWIGNWVADGALKASTGFNTIVPPGNAEVNIIGATFKNIKHYPALQSGSNSIINVCNTTFENTKQVAINVFGLTRVSVNGCTFKDNTAGNGNGGITVFGGQLSIKNSVLDNTRIDVKRNLKNGYGAGFKSDICTGGTTVINAGNGCNTIYSQIHQSNKDQVCVDYTDTCLYKVGTTFYMDADFDTWKPSEKCESLSVTASSHGDPHFSKWDGKRFDYQGGCDLVLIQNANFANGLGLHVHARTKISTSWSYIESAAVRIGDHTLEVSGGEKQDNYWLDGVEVADMEAGDAVLGDFSIHLKKITDHQGRARIDLGNGNALSIETYKKFVNINVKVGSVAAFEGSHGMYGSFPSGKSLARDKVTLVEDVNEFGQEWQVLPTDPKLFHSDGSVQYPMKCMLPDVTKKSQKRRLGESMITNDAAALACAHVSEADRDACIFDVLATSDKEMAGTY